MSQPAEKREGKPAMLKDRDFVWEDPLDLESELTEDERMVRDTAKGFSQDYLMPKVVADDGGVWGATPQARRPGARFSGTRR